jgi:undecaprenyl-diphosphatase
MVDLSRKWPLGLGEKTWWVAMTAALAVLALTLVFDRALSVWAQSSPEALNGVWEFITGFGESGWILYPAAALLVVTAGLALLVRWKLMRTMLWQFSALYGFILAGVGLPSLISTLAKRAIGRGRPMHFDEVGIFGFRWNLTDWTYQSFPSGHATTAFALAAVIGFLSPRWFYPMLVLAALIAVSRVVLGVHYPSDVTGGAILGLLGAYSARFVFALRGWMFRVDPAGGVVRRPLASLARYVSLKRRGTAPTPQPGRP